MIKNIFIVGAGGFLGSVIRLLCYQFIKSQDSFIITTLINCVGSFAIGLIIGLHMKNQSISHQWKLFLATGLCGGFTTFSTFSWENLQLIQTGKYIIALFNIIASLLFGIIAAFLGYKLSELL